MVYRVIKSINVRLVGYVTRNGRYEKYKILAGRTERRSQLGIPRNRIIIT
jgi:hypothetical protein